MNEKYLEVMNNIAKSLITHGVPFYYQPCFDGMQFRFPWAGDADIAIHSGTYGNEYNRVESYQFPWDFDDVSVLSADEFISNILDLWEKQKEFYSQWEPYTELTIEKEN